MAQHQLLVEDVFRRQHVDLALVGLDQGRGLRWWRRDQTAYLDNLEADRQRCQRRVVIERHRHQAASLRGAGAQRGVDTNRAERLEHRVVVGILQSDQHIVGVDVALGVADQDPILVQPRRRGADLLDALRVARKPEQRLDGLVPATAGGWRTTIIGKALCLAAIAAVQRLENDAVAFGQHIEQQERIASTGLVEDAGQDQPAVERVIAQSVANRHRQLDRAVGRAKNRLAAIGLEFLGHRRRNLVEENDPRIERVDQLRQGIRRCRVGQSFLQFVEHDFDRGLVDDVGQAPLRAQQGFAGHQQRPLLGPGDVVVDSDRRQIRTGTSLILLQSRQPGLAAGAEDIVLVIGIDIGEEAGLGRVEVVHRSGTGRLGPQLAGVVLEERRRRLLADRLSENEGLGTVRQQADRVRWRDRGCRRSGKAELRESRTRGIDPKHTESPARGPRREILEQHVGVGAGRGIIVQATAEIGAQREHRLAAGPDRRGCGERVFVVRVVAGQVEIVLHVNPRIGEQLRVDRLLAEHLTALLAGDDDALRVKRPARRVAHRLGRPEHAAGIGTIPGHGQLPALLLRSRAGIAIDRNDRTGATGTIVGRIRTLSIVIGVGVDDEAVAVGFIVERIDDRLADLDLDAVDKQWYRRVRQRAHDLDQGRKLQRIQRRAVDIDNRRRAGPTGGEQAAGHRRIG